MIQHKATLKGVTFLLISSFLIGCNNSPEIAAKQEMSSNISLNKEVIYVDHLKERLQKEGNRLVEVRVSLSDWMQLPEIRELVSENNAPEIKMLHAKSATEGVMLHISIPLAKRDLDPIEIRRYLEDEKATIKISSMKEDLEKMLKNGVDEGVWAYSFDAYGEADDILEWWEQHSENIRIVQTVLYSFDRAQRAFSPSEEIQ